jgi:hypothetical protein
MEKNYNLYIFMAIIIVIIVMAMMRKENFISSSYTDQFTSPDLLPMHYLNETQSTLYYAGNGQYLIKRASPNDKFHIYYRN